MAATGVPRKKKGESMVAYHDRLADLIHGADEGGDLALSAALQRKAGKLAHDHPRVAEAHRRDAKSSGPGTYPWYMCVDDQLARGGGSERAKAICGRIRSDSRRRYPEYWAKREGYSSASKRDQEAKTRAEKAKKRRTAVASENPVFLAPALASLGMHAGIAAATQAVAAGLAVNPASDGVPFCALGLDAGPHARGSRDVVVVIDRSGTVLEMREIHNEHGLAQLCSEYPGLPVFGPLRVTYGQVRELQRASVAPRVEHRRGR